ncbi:CerR family C-terminal domain-containing protein [Pararobbsia alpina]|uniref:HTH-type transcriptional dual regulator CecR n=1 Tax=Pararobbsia alpina TaxID=621374 RepID=A0A6S7BH82_9BURK|nr:CerR family C-terminal domain-containing protein [Pararobbsia alpina]CAB3791098.1 HTH-type transcriptional dual regulator CecR [Pararobbsia alpina]
MSDAKRLRRPSAGGYVRGDETRLRIIEAAIELFGEHGFEGASTRDIAARAGVNAPALQYYFENKEGVFRACAEYIADDVWRKFEPVVAHATEVLRGEADAEALIDAFVRIQEVIADRMIVKANTSGALNPRLFFAREQAGHEPSVASEVLTQRLRKPVNDVGAQLIARITGMAADNPVTLIRMFSLQGQLLMFHAAPRTTLGLLGWKEIDAEKGELLKATVREQTRILLRQWSEARPTPHRRAASKRSA